MTANALKPLLVAEGNPNDMFLFTRLLKSAGAMNALHIALDGPEAIRLLTPVVEKNALVAKPAIAFVETNLPQLSGFEVLAWIRRQRSLDDLPVILLATAPTSAELKRGASLGAQCFLKKLPRQLAISHLLENAGKFNGRDSRALFDLPDNLLHRGNETR